MQKKFIQFLKDNNALIPFCCNIAIGKIARCWKGNKYQRKGISLTELFNNPLILPEEWFDTFSWIKSTEDSYYWLALDNKWFNICVNEYKKQ